MGSSCKKINNCLIIIILLFLIFLLSQKKDKNKNLAEKFYSAKKNKKNNIVKNPIKLVLYKSNNCYHCQQFKPTWDNIKLKLNKIYTNNQILVDEVECSSGDSRCNSPYINGVPTVVLYKASTQPMIYNNSRTVSGVISWVKKNM